MNVAILTVSDSAAAGEQADLSGPLLRELAETLGCTVVCADILPDDEDAIANWLAEVTDARHADLALTSGGTGLGPRDVTPEATRRVIEKEAQGIAEAIRAAGLAKTPRAMLSRNVAGIRGGTLIINLSGSPKAVREQWDAIEPALQHAVDTVGGGGAHPEADAARRR